MFVLAIMRGESLETLANLKLLAMHSISSLLTKNVVHLDNYIFCVECPEPEGSVVRYVRPFYASLENIEKFWLRAKNHRTIYGREILDAKDFMDIFFYQDEYGVYKSHGLFWVIDDFEGMFYITNMQHPHDCLVHYTFFSGRHKGREKLVEKMLDYVFNTLDFRRISAEIPAYAKPQASKFATALGFFYEGKRRFSLPYKGKYFHVNLFGMLRDEFNKRLENGRTQD